jgi:drug/metabolite transporter (DMT)-like permease
VSGRLWVLAAATLWSLGGVLIRQATHWGVAPEAVACLRSAVAAAVLLWALPAVRPAVGARFAIAGLFYAALLASFVWATAITSAAHAIFLQYLYPLLVAPAARILYGERLGRTGAGALALGAAGVAVILAGSAGRVDPAGLAFGLASAVCFAGFVLAQRGVTGGHPAGIACAYNLLTALALLPLAWGDLGLDTRQWALVVGIGVVQVGVPYIFFLRGLRRIPATDAAILTLWEPVLNPLWAYLWLGEAPDTATLGGGALILAGVAVFLAARRTAADQASGG